MKKKLWLVLSLAVLLTVIGMLGCNTASPGNATITGGIFNNQSTGIWVNGEGKVTAVPDVSVLSLGVQAQAITVKETQSQASASMDAIVKAVKAGGVADKDIQTQYFNIQQLTQYDDKTRQQVITGYSVTNTVTVKMRNVANTGAIIDAVVKAGGDNTRINSISFTIDDPTPYKNSARQLAIADAKAKAKQMADLAGVKLGDPTYISESGSSVPIKSASGGIAPSAPSETPTPISPGEMVITLTVQITYNID
jgi:uncharacterized protein